ncbi:helical membrane plugin domain-containing protein [Paenibacillus sp. BAC0078]
MSETITKTQALTKDELLDQLLKPEVQESLTTLVEQLPQITQLVSVLSKSIDFVQAVATDEVLKSDTVGAIKELAEPVVDSVKTMAANVIEAKDRANESSETISLFGMMRMIKDPQVQKMLRFMNAYLQISGERNPQK